MDQARLVVASGGGDGGRSSGGMDGGECGTGGEGPSNGGWRGRVGDQGRGAAQIPFHYRRESANLNALEADSAGLLEQARAILRAGEEEGVLDDEVEGEDISRGGRNITFRQRQQTANLLEQARAVVRAAEGGGWDEGEALAGRAAGRVVNRGVGAAGEPVSAGPQQPHMKTPFHYRRESAYVNPNDNLLEQARAAMRVGTPPHTVAPQEAGCSRNDGREEGAAAPAGAAAALASPTAALPAAVARCDEGGSESRCTGDGSSQAKPRDSAFGSLGAEFVGAGTSMRAALVDSARLPSAHVGSRPDAAATQDLYELD